jgi:uncharacterized protein YjiS (DUF1127 family)
MIAAPFDISHEAARCLRRLLRVGRLARTGHFQRYCRFRAELAGMSDDPALCLRAAHRLLDAPRRRYSR